jgi:hypothetical protein
MRVFIEFNRVDRGVTLVPAGLHRAELGRGAADRDRLWAAWIRVLIKSLEIRALSENQMRIRSAK